MEAFLTKYYRSVFSLLILAIAGLSFYVGILEGKQQGGKSVTLACSPDILSKLAIPTTALANGTKAPTTTPVASGAFAGSKNGTKYYTPGCAGLDRIKPENLVWFADAESATLQGYTPGSC